MAMVAEAAEEEAYATSLEAILYGYSRVEMARRIHNETHRVRPDQVIFAPANAFYYFDRLAQPGDGLVIKAPNNDTLYASAYLDLSDGPVVLRVPEMSDRYYVALVVDAAGNVSNRLGSTVSGAGGVDHVFVGPGYEGTIPEGARPVRMDGNDLWLLMRITTDGTAEDEGRAAEILKRFRLTPLDNLADLGDGPGINLRVQDQPIVSALDPIGKLEFFAVLDQMIRRNPPPEADRGLVARWERIGLVAKGFDADNLSDPVRRGMERALASGEKIVAAAQFGIANTVNGWNYSVKIGRITTDWALNAAIARGGYGNLAEDSVYYQRSLDAEGIQLTGENAYLLTFPAGQLPPVGRFWSVTAYDQASFDLIENPIARYSFGDRTPDLVFHTDGSLTIAIQKEAPEDPVLRANWLPVGAGPFYLIMRTYDPAPEIISGTWAPPALQRAK